MFGKNKILGPEGGDGTILMVNSLFHTIQGEGPYSGRQAVFIRLAGCNLACNFCDTEFDSYVIYTVDQLLEAILLMKLCATAFCKPLVVITGGEPFRQNINVLCLRLLQNGFHVQIESNGTLYRPIPKEVEIVCSPKNNGLGYKHIRCDILSHTVALKFIISASNLLYSNIADVGQGKFRIPVYVQPMDEYDEAKNNANLQLAIQIANDTGAIVSVQLHKIMGVP